MLLDWGAVPRGVEHKTLPPMGPSITCGCCIIGYRFESFRLGPRVDGPWVRFLGFKKSYSLVLFPELFKVLFDMVTERLDISKQNLEVLAFRVFSRVGFLKHIAIRRFWVLICFFVYKGDGNDILQSS